MIKILLDPQIFNAQKFGGISKYHIEVYDILKSKDTIQIDCPIYYTENDHFLKSQSFSHSYQQRNAFFIRHSKVFKSYRPARLYNTTNLYTISRIKKQNFDVFIPTYYDPYFLDALKEKPFVLTVHDMIYELFPQYFTEEPAIARNKKLLMEKATKIIAVSENTKTDILKIYPHIPASKITVIHLATTINPNQTVLPTLPKNYILYVGNRWLYKNFNFFLKSAAEVLKNRPDLHIVCAGGKPFSNEEIQLINDLEISNQVQHHAFEDSELPAYYQNARCFVFPSEYEGFGIPVLEAMACSCPVVLAHHSSFPEVAGDAGVYFKLNDSSDLSDKIVLLLENEHIRQDYITRGLAQSKKFTWEKTAEQTLQIYQDAAALGLKSKLS